MTDEGDVKLEALDNTATDGDNVAFEVGGFWAELDRNLVVHVFAEAVLEAETIGKNRGAEEFPASVCRGALE